MFIPFYNKVTVTDFRNRFYNDVLSHASFCWKISITVIYQLNHINALALESTPLKPGKSKKSPAKHQPIHGLFSVRIKHNVLPGFLMMLSSHTVSPFWGASRAHTRLFKAAADGCSDFGTPEVSPQLCVNRQIQVSLKSKLLAVRRQLCNTLWQLC